ncbi:MAG TPA: cupin domain-containing protein [Stenotrophomonas sp.]|nr:cupin domain-containing protein [Stenotrophomonas sp.]
MRTLTMVLLLAFSAQAAAQQATVPTFSDRYAKTPSELAALSPTGGAGGSGNAKVQVVTLLGDPARPGPYSQLLRVAPHASIPAHHHAGDRSGAVLSGTWHFGYGDRFDPGKLKTLPPGSIYTEPANVAHFARTGDEAVTVLITGVGPTDTVYENPAEAPPATH